MKSGAKTSEFWVTVVRGCVTAVLGVLVTNGLVSGELSGTVTQVAGLLVAAAVPVVLGWLAVSYTHARTALKIEDSKTNKPQLVDIEPAHPFRPE
jgi:hypothetical protein